MKQFNSWIAILTACFFLTGLVISSQAVSREEYLSSLETQSPENLVILWRNMNEKTLSLRTELFELQQEKRLLETQAEEELVAVESIQNEIRRIRMFNGDLSVQGEGLEIVIESSTPIIYLELLDLVNELWNSGAQAISINDKRITSRSHIGQNIFSSDYFVAVNNQPLSYPIVIKAIGNSQNLQSGLNITGGLIDTLNSYGVYPIVFRRDQVVLPRSNDADFYKALEKKAEETGS